MDIPFILLLFIGWIIFKNVKSAGKSLDKAAKSDEWQENISAIQARVKDHAARNEFETSSKGEDDWSYERQSYRQQSAGTPFGQRSRHGPLQKRLAAAKKTQALKRTPTFKPKPRENGRGKDYGLNNRHSPQKDQNRHRRDDWGSRQSEIITTQSLLVLLAFGFIALYVLSKISPSDVGL